jgi:hypothetical protein
MLNNNAGDVEQQERRKDRKDRKDYARRLVAMEEIEKEWPVARH